MSTASASNARDCDDRRTPLYKKIRLRSVGRAVHFLFPTKGRRRFVYFEKRATPKHMTTVFVITIINIYGNEHELYASETTGRPLKGRWCHDVFGFFRNFLGGHVTVLPPVCDNKTRKTLSVRVKKKKNQNYIIRSITFVRSLIFEVFLVKTGFFYNGVRLSY